MSQTETRKSWCGITQTQLHANTQWCIPKCRTFPSKLHPWYLYIGIILWCMVAPFWKLVTLCQTIEKFKAYHMIKGNNFLLRDTVPFFFTLLQEQSQKQLRLRKCLTRLWLTKSPQECTLFMVYFYSYLSQHYLYLPFPLKFYSSKIATVSNKYHCYIASHKKKQSCKWSFFLCIICCKVLRAQADLWILIMQIHIFLNLNTLNTVFF